MIFVRFIIPHRQRILAFSRVFLYTFLYYS